MGFKRWQNSHLGKVGVVTVIIAAAAYYWCGVGVGGLRCGLGQGKGHAGRLAGVRPTQPGCTESDLSQEEGGTLGCVGVQLEGIKAAPHNASFCFLGVWLIEWGASTEPAEGTVQLTDADLSVNSQVQGDSSVGFPLGAQHSGQGYLGTCVCTCMCGWGGGGAGRGRGPGALT